MQRVVILAVVTVSLFACAARDAAFYKHSPSVSALEVPPDLTQPTIDDTYAIPVISAAYSEDIVLRDGTRISVRRDGAIRWLEVEGDIEKIWSRSRDYWLDNKIGLDWENRSLGIMETKWLDHYSSRFAQDKFRLRIEPGDKKGLVWLFVSHRGRQQIVNDTGISDRWESTFSDPELEVEVTGLLLAFLGMEPAEAKKKAKATASNANLAELKVGKKEAALVIHQSYDKAWALLLRSVDRAGYIIEERDQETGYLKLSTGTSDGALAAFNIFGTRQDIYELKVESLEAQTRITVLDKEKQTDIGSNAKEFLKRIENRI